MQTAEIIALRLILSRTLKRLAEGSPDAKNAISQGLFDAWADAERMVFACSDEKVPDHLMETMRAVEEVRTAVLGH